MFKCTDEYQNASLAKPITIGTNSHIVNCSKDPLKHLTVAVQTTAGPAQTALNIDSVDEAIANLKSDLEAKIASLSERIKSNMVVAFATSTCPPPWKTYEPAAGRFVRGIDAGGHVDPDGIRSFGSLQSDGVGLHTHQMGTGGADSSDMVAGGATQRLAHFLPDGYNGGGPKQTSTNDNGISETRPKNVALMYCILQ
jgi:hypothetical protein